MTRTVSDVGTAAPAPATASEDLGGPRRTSEDPRRERHRGGRLVVILEAGHLPHVERPEAVLPLVDDHLDRTRTRS
jgi:pimeloyl-ACP methyl ester carboxylesterase